MCLLEEYFHFVKTTNSFLSHPFVFPSIDLVSFNVKKCFVWPTGEIRNTTTMGWGSRRVHLFSVWWRTSNIWPWGSSPSHRNRGAHINKCPCTLKHQWLHHCNNFSVFRCCIFNYFLLYGFVTDLSLFVSLTLFSSFKSSLSNCYMYFNTRHLCLDLKALPWLSCVYTSFIFLFPPGWNLCIKLKEWPTAQQEQQASSSSRGQGTWTSVPRFSSTSSS